MDTAGRAESNDARARKRVLQAGRDLAEVDAALCLALHNVLTGRIEPGVASAAATLARAIVATRQAGAEGQADPDAPKELIQLDTVHLRPLPGVERRQFTAIDGVSRCAVGGVRSEATAGTSVACLDQLVARMPFPVEAIQVDGGSAWS